MAGSTRSSTLLDQELLRFQVRGAPGNQSSRPWTIGDAFEGTQIFGATGSGKTTGSGQHLALHMLKAGFGGLVLTAKPDELERWANFSREPQNGVQRQLGYCALAGYQPKDVIVVGTRLKEYAAMGLTVPTEGHHLDFLDYEYQYHQKRETEAATHNLVYLFTTAMAAGEDRESLTDPYWEDALRQLVTNAVDLAAMAKGTVRLADISEIIRTAPQTRAEAQSEQWRAGSVFWHSYYKPAVARNPAGSTGRYDLEEVSHYWGLDFAGLADRTRSVIVSSFTSKATPMLRGALRRTFCRGESSSFRIEDSHEGKVIIIDFPVKEYGEAGRFAQVLFKTLWQRATERRDERCEKSRPVFLWADEAQYFITKHDMLFQQTARSKHAATVYLTQNISNYYAVMGGKHPQAATDAFLGNLLTKVLHSNGDPATNEWAARMVGRGVQVRESDTVSTEGTYSMGTNQAIEDIMQSEVFTKLRTGGERNDYQIDALIFKSGARWSRHGPTPQAASLTDVPREDKEGRPFIWSVFDQRASMTIA